MSSQTSPISIPSIFRTLSSAPHTREHHQAARQLASLDPKRFLSNLQVAAVNGSPQAIAAVKADMLELEDIFYKLSKSGHDVSAAQRDFQMLSHFVSQLTSMQKQRSLPSSTSSSQRSSSSHAKDQTRSSSQHVGGHSRTSSLPTTTGSYEQQSRSRSGSSSIDNSLSSTRYHPHAVHALGQVQPPSHSLAAQGKGLASGSAPSSRSSSSSSSSNRSSSSSHSHHQTTGASHPTNVVAPIPSRLSKPRRHSEPATLPSDAMRSGKKVHFASHATVYTFHQSAPALVPPPRPSCIPRVGSDSPRSSSSTSSSRH